MNRFLLNLSIILILILAKDSWGTKDCPPCPMNKEDLKDLVCDANSYREQRKLGDDDEEDEKKFYFSNNSKIVKPPHKYPFMAELMYSGKHVCSCVLVSPNFFLTAASCIFGLKQSKPEPSAKSGTTDEPVTSDGQATTAEPTTTAIPATTDELAAKAKPENEIPTTADGTLVDEDFVKKFTVQIGNTKDTLKILKVKRLIKHISVRVDPKDGLPTDVMLVEVDEKLDLSGNTRPICITRNYLDDYKEATVCGKVKVENDRFLEEMTLKVWTFKECQYVLKNIDTNIGTFLTCTGGVKRGKSACGGDKGAPLFVINNNRYELIGIKARDPLSCENSLPTLFTKASVFRRWIKKFTQYYSYEKCGTIPSDLGRQEELPFMASLKFKKEHLCSGAIVSRTHILTSAKCLYKAKPDKNVSTDCDGKVTDKDFVKEFSIGVGNSGDETFEVDKITKHPMFMRNQSEGLPLDAMLVKLKKPLNFSPKVHDICLTADYRNKYRDADVATYGNNTQKLSLKSVETNVWKTLKCQKALKYSDLNEASFMLCGGWKQKNIGKKEKGAPLYITNRKGKFELLGVKSSSSKTRKSNLPVLFTKVSNLRRWVKSVAPDYSDSDCGGYKPQQLSNDENEKNKPKKRTFIVVSTFWENDTHSALQNVTYLNDTDQIPKFRAPREAMTDLKPRKKANFEFYKMYRKNRTTIRPEGFPKSGKYNKEFTNPKDVYPFIVTICFKNNLHSCFGVIASPNYILASANCLFRVYKDPYKEPASEADGTITDEKFVDNFSIVIGISGVKKRHYKVNSIIKHPLMKRNTRKGLPIDAMLIQLNETMNFSDNLHSICINKNYFENDTEGTVAKAKEEKTCSDTKLRKKNTKIWSHEDCLKAIQRMDTNTGAVITCAGTHDDLCGIDDGAPLFLKRGDKYHLIGLKSRNPTNCRSNLPTLFTKVSVLRRWIRKYAEGFDEKNCG